MPLTAYMPYTPQAEALATLNRLLDPRVDLHTGEMPEPAQYTLLINGRPTPEQLSASPHLNTLLIPFAGLPADTQTLMREHPHIAVHNLHHNAPPTAETALTLLLTVAKRTVPADREFRKHDWTPRYVPYPQQQLRGKRALLLGYGAIGQYLAPILRALGMSVRAIRRTNPDAANGIFTIDHLHTLLPTTDVLIIALPGTPATQNLIGEQELALLPQGAMLVNIGRATVVDQVALYAALASGHLHGAGLDVWYRYPTTVDERTNTPPADVPFHELDNVVMSPHRAAGAGNADIEQLRMRALADVLNMAARDEALPHRVDIALGY